MKKNYLLLSLLWLISMSTAFAHALPVNTPQAKKSFAKQYPGALYAHWELVSGEDIHAVRFVYHEQSMVAYYENDGKSLGFARVITKEKLPTKVRTALENLAQHYQVEGVQELVLRDKHCFYLNLVNEHEKILVQVDSNGHVDRN